jgi:hypothetical protein
LIPAVFAEASVSFAALYKRPHHVVDQTGKRFIPSERRAHLGERFETIERSKSRLSQLMAFRRRHGGIIKYGDHVQ